MTSKIYTILGFFEVFIMCEKDKNKMIKSFKKPPLSMPSKGGKWEILINNRKKVLRVVDFPRSTNIYI